MAVDTAKRYLLKLKENNNVKAINEYSKALERNLLENPNSENNKARLEVFNSVFEKENKKSKK